MKKIIAFTTFFTAITIIAAVVYNIYPKVPETCSLNERQFIMHGNTTLSNFKPNSKQLFEHGIDDLNYKMVECDVCCTQDNVLVLSHDDCIEGEDLNHRYYISQLSYNELKRANPDIYTLSALLKKCKSAGGVICMLDIKCKLTPETTRLIFDEIKSCGMLDAVLIETGCSESEAYRNSAIDYFVQLDSEGLLSYQFDNCFQPASIDKIVAQHYNEKSKNIVISYSAPVRLNFSLFSLLQTINHGHKHGCIMKVATIDKVSVAYALFFLGIDLINTNTLVNI